MEIRFNITKEGFENMSDEEFEAFEMAQDGIVKMYRLRPAICRFMVDENGAPIPHEEALKISGKIKLKEMSSFLEQFFSAMREAALPKVSGSSSRSPTGLEQPDSPSPAG